MADAMLTPALRRVARRLASGCLTLALVACAPLPMIRHTPTPRLGGDTLATLAVDEPAPGEVVVVVNDNRKMVHAGMFVGDRLFDPAGSYLSSRRPIPDWAGPSLRDYLRFQLDDGPEVRLYRFALTDDRLARVNERLDQAGNTLPLFCAAKVQNILGGIAPFESLPQVWLVTPATLAGYLDAVLDADRQTGRCTWPDGASCYPQAPSEARETATEPATEPATDYAVQRVTNPGL